MNQLIRLDRAPRLPGGVKRKILGTLVPFGTDGIDKFPRLFNLIAATKSVASPLIASSKRRSYASGDALSKLVPVMKIHFYRFDPQAGAGELRIHTKRHAFIGLDADDQGVVVNCLSIGIEQYGRSSLEMNCDLCAGLGQALPNA